MTTVRIKFRPSLVKGRQGSIFYQVIHGRISRQLKTNYRIYPDEWNSRQSEIIMSGCDINRESYLVEISDMISRDLKIFSKVIDTYENRGTAFTADDVIYGFLSVGPDETLFKFMDSLIEHLKSLGRIRTSETYKSTLNSFRRFREGRDLPMDEIDSDLIMAYEAYLRNNGVSPNSSSFYMRNLRAVYNRAVEKELTLQKFPFRHVYTGVDKTVKRAVTLKSIKQIKDMDLSGKPALDLARDMFLFSFYTRGMSFIDMSYLTKKNLNHGVLTYRRCKTGQLLSVKWEKCMQEIVCKYNNPKSPFLLPLIDPFSSDDNRKQYLSAAHKINRSLKFIGAMIDISIPLTMYVARHAWASIARSKNVPLSVISEGMGHDSESTTRIYLASLDTMAVDKANSMILKSL